MGPRVMRRLPKYVHGFVDRHGKPRFYFRRLGFERKPLQGLPYSADFMNDYEAALAGQPVPVGVYQDAAGQHDGAGAELLRFTRFPRAETLNATRLSLDHRTSLWDHGDKRAADLRRDHIVKLMAARAEKPGAANGLRMALRVLMKHAIDVGLRADDPTREVRAIRVRTAGHHSWTDDEIAQFERHHAIGSRARLALALLLYTGQRRGDVIRMGAQHIREASLHVKQQKTGAELIIPVHPNLATVIAAAPRQHLTFVTTGTAGRSRGQPLAVGSANSATRRDCRTAPLMGCARPRLDGLAEAGCTAHEIGAITGHASLTELVRYTKSRRSAETLPESAMTKTRTSVGKLNEKFAKNRKKSL